MDRSRIMGNRLMYCKQRSTEVLIVIYDIYKYLLNLHFPPPGFHHNINMHPLLLPGITKQGIASSYLLTSPSPKISFVVAFLSLVNNNT